jgi:hypothetical protein
MTGFQNFARYVVIIQSLLWASVTAVFLFVLPAYGFSSFYDFNDAAKIQVARPWMYLLNWSDLFFAMTLLIVVLSIHQQTKTRVPFLLRNAFTIILIGAALWFVLHDLGFHIIGWPGIEQDPTSTNFAMDRLLWGVRNTLFFAIGLLSIIANKKTSPII